MTTRNRILTLLAIVATLALALIGAGCGATTTPVARQTMRPSS